MMLLILSCAGDEIDRTGQGGDAGKDRCSILLPVVVKLVLHCVPHREQ